MKINDCKTRFSFRCPTPKGDGVTINAVYDHMGGNLDLEIDSSRTICPISRANAGREFCREHGINYFTIREVLDTLREAGIGLADISQND